MADGVVRGKSTVVSINATFKVSEKGSSKYYVWPTQSVSGNVLYFSGTAPMTLTHGKAYVLEVITSLTNSSGLTEVIASSVENIYP